MLKSFKQKLNILSKMTKNEDYRRRLIIILLINITLLFFSNIYLFGGMRQLDTENKMLYMSIASFNMENTTIEDFRTTGIYHYEGFYCVLTKGRSLDQIQRTEYHEAFHSFIAGDFDPCYDKFGNPETCKQHFCKSD